MIYTVTFSPSIDYVMLVPALTLGRVNRAVQEEYYPGGKGVNVSVMLARLGVQSKALGFAAGFTGAALEEMLQACGCDSRLIRLPAGNTRINVKLKSETESDINGQGPLIPQAALDALLQRLESLEKGDILVLAGAVPHSVPQDIYEKIMERLLHRGIRFVVDATGKLMGNTLKHRPFLIKPNSHELGELFGVALETPEEAAKYGKRAQQLGARNVLVSLAEKGALLVTEEGKTLYGHAPQGKVVNAVGAGDSMVAGFLVGWEHTQDYQKALDLAIAAGSASAFEKWLATKENVASLLKNPWEYGFLA